MMLCRSREQVKLNRGFKLQLRHLPWMIEAQLRARGDFDSSSAVQTLERRLGAEVGVAGGTVHRGARSKRSRLQS